MAYLLHSLTAQHVRAEQEYFLQQGWQSTLLIPAVERALHGRVREYATQEGLRAIELDHVRRFHQRHYAPANAVVAIVSKRPHAEVLALAQRYFGGIRGLPATSGPSVRQRPLTRFVQLDGAGPSPRSTSIFWRSPAHLSDGDAALDLIAAHLSRTLHRELGADARSVLVRQLSGSEYSEFAIQVDADDDVDLAVLTRQLRAAVGEVCETPLSADALQAARNSLFRRSPAPRARAASLATNTQRSGALSTHEMGRSRLDSLSPRNVRRAAFHFLRGPSVGLIYEHARRPRPAIIRGAP